jgi:aryl-alcohol dehydrogenase-like predicted oxidoreductase
MLQARLGAHGPVVSRLGLGTMAFTQVSEADGTRLIHRALDAGVTLIDTADVYGDGSVEGLVGRALRPRRDEVILATKVGLPLAGEPGSGGNSGRWIARAVEMSLRRLGVDHIDLYQLHRPDAAIPISESLGALDDLVHAGKVRWIGTSAFPAEYIVEAQWISTREGLAAPISEQSAYSMLVRSPERAILPTCRHLGLGVLVWSPLNGGWLTGKYRRGQPPPAGSRAASGNPFVRADDTAKLDYTERLATLAERVGRPLLDVALAWCLEHPSVSSVLIGPRTAEQLDQLLAANVSPLDTAVLDAIDECTTPGADVDPRNTGWSPPALTPQYRRRKRPPRSTVIDRQDT